MNTGYQRYQPNYKDFESCLKGIQRIYFAMNICLLVFVGLLLSGVIQTPPNTSEEFVNLLFMVFLATSVLCLAISFIVPKIMLKKSQGPSLQSKLHAFYSSKIIAAAQVEGAALMWPILVMMSGNWLYLAGSGVCLFVMMLHFPTQNQLEDYLGMRAKDVNAELGKAS